MPTGDDSHFPPEKNTSEQQKIAESASEWLALKENRPLTPAEAAEFSAWLAADSRHREAVEELESTWEHLDQLAFYPRSLKENADPDFFAKAAPARRKKRSPVWIAAAAAVVMLCGVLFRQFSSPEKPTLANHVVAGEFPLVSLLPDGSEVELNAGSKLVIQYTAGIRRVRLERGEAHFMVQKDASRPFIVDAQQVSVRAVGTAFNVLMGAERVEVLVTEGKVQVERSVPPAASPVAVTHSALSPEQVGSVPVSVSASAAFLVAGQKAVLPSAATGELLAPQIQSLAPDELDRALAWQSGRLVFEETSLTEVVARFNRYAEYRGDPTRLILGDPQLEIMRFTGRINSDNIESFVELMVKGFGLTAEKTAKGGIVLKK